MAAYKSIVYKEIVEIDGLPVLITTCDHTDSINQAIDDGAISHLNSEVVAYIRDDLA